MGRPNGLSRAYSASWNRSRMMITLSLFREDVVTLDFSRTGGRPLFLGRPTLRPRVLPADPTGPYRRRIVRNVKNSTAFGSMRSELRAGRTVVFGVRRDLSIIIPPLFSSSFTLWETPSWEYANESDACKRKLFFLSLFTVLYCREMSAGTRRCCFAPGESREANVVRRQRPRCSEGSCAFFVRSLSLKHYPS